MSQPLVFDHTAVVALFRADSTAFHYWTRADAAEVRVVMPAAAVAEANRMLRASWNAWEAVLYPGLVEVPPLDEHTAVEAGLAGDIATGQVMYEARQLSGVVVTQARGAYQHTELPVLEL